MRMAHLSAPAYANNWCSLEESVHIAFDEMTIIRLYYARLLATRKYNSQNQLLLASALGLFHQQSTSLESQIQLMPTSGYQH